MRRWLGIAGSLFGLWLLAGSAAAQDPRQNEPGKFDFYVLALSWSPSYCEQAGERADVGEGDADCGTGQGRSQEGPAGAALEERQASGAITKLTNV